MRFVHPAQPGNAVRLAYCMNLHAAETLDGVLAGLERVTLPLAERLFDRRAGREKGEGFGVGIWLPGPVALELGAEPEKLERFTSFLVDHGLDAFTFNAFPFGDFHAEGLKEQVFKPTWKSAERMAYTLAVAKVAAAARERFTREWNHDLLHPRDEAHLSVSTHAGDFGVGIAAPEDLDRIAENFCVCAVNLARIEDETGLRIVLSIEPEPRSSANDTGELAALHERIRTRAPEVIGRGYAEMAALSVEIADRHLGTCLDTCHTAVEFEPVAEAFTRSTHAGVPLGKLQFSSALAVREPAQNPAAREALFAMAEPVYLHQATALLDDAQPPSLQRFTDLPEVRAAWEQAGSTLEAARELRCHFHVPVDLGSPASGPTPSSTAHSPDGLATTRPQADQLLAHALANPERWGSPELHLEIETYTWDILPAAARGPGDLVDGLEREYRHVLAQLSRHGWKRAVPQP